jgi:hypothetical protein
MYYYTVGVVNFPEVVSAQTVNIYCQCVVRIVCNSSQRTSLFHRNPRAKTNRYVPRASKKTFCILLPSPPPLHLASRPLTIWCKTRYFDQSILSHAKCSRHVCGFDLPICKINTCSTRSLEQDVLTISEDETFICVFSRRRVNYNTTNTLRKCGEVEKTTQNDIPRT